MKRSSWVMLQLAIVAVGIWFGVWVFRAVTM